MGTNSHKTLEFMTEHFHRLKQLSPGMFLGTINELSAMANGGNFDGEAAPAGNYRFQAIGSLGEESVEVPVLAQSRIKGVSWDESMGEIYVEIADGRSIALNEITHISE